MTEIDKLIRMNIELEGLLKVLRDRDSLEARDLLSDKIEEYTSALNAFLFAKHDDKPETLQDVVDKGEDALEEAHHVEVKDQEAQETEDIPEDDAAEKAVEDENRFHDAVPETPKTVVPETPKTAVPETPKVAEPLQPVKQQADDASGDKSAKLLKAFTLNDRFRFRRELFAGDDEDFHETLRLIADMDSYAEACDYLYNDMMWDRTSPVVEEFMAILAANMPK